MKRESNENKATITILIEKPTRLTQTRTVKQQQKLIINNNIFRTKNYGTSNYRNFTHTGQRKQTSKSKRRDTDVVQIVRKFTWFHNTLPFGYQISPEAASAAAATVTVRKQQLDAYYCDLHS